MRHRIAALAATTVMVAGGAIAAATPASATTDPPGGTYDHTWTTTDAAHGGTVYIMEHGDIVKLCDTAADGYAPRATILINTGTDTWRTAYDLVASGGLGTCVQASASMGGKYDLPENTYIEVDIWLGPNYKYYSSHMFLNDH